MKRLFAIAIVMIAVGCRAQVGRPLPRFRPRVTATTAAYLQWTWIAPVGSPVAVVAYNLYQAAAPCPTDGTIGTLSYVLIAQGVTTTSFVQSPVPTGTTCTYATSVSAVGVESVPSATFQSDTAAPSAPGTPSAEYVK